MNRLIAIVCIAAMLIGAMTAAAHSEADLPAAADSPVTATREMSMNDLGIKFYYSNGIYIRMIPSDEALAQLPEGRWGDRIRRRIEEQGGVFIKSLIPNQYREDITECGTVERFEYETYVYTASGERGEAITKECFVYLPYGYDPGKAYNILYLMPGYGETAGFWLNQGDYAPGGPENKNGRMYTLQLLDNLIAKDYCDPLIVATAATEEYADAPHNEVGEIHYEFHNDLIPAVESRYATYARGDVSREGLIASREHRAYFGMSMSAVMSWDSILRYCTDCFSYIGTSAGSAMNVPAIAERMNGVDSPYEILYWYNGNASGDETNLNQWICYLNLLNYCPGRFTEGIEFWAGANCLYLEKPSHEHIYAAWIVDLYNCLGAFFVMAGD